ncbi:hypothetical protein E2320_020341 [Naja naja]|nr:hypothetical protein E2320_020341 [Naja naja]
MDIVHSVCKSIFLLSEYDDVCLLLKGVIFICKEEFFLYKLLTEIVCKIYFGIIVPFENIICDNNRCEFIFACFINMSQITDLFWLPKTSKHTLQCLKIHVHHLDASISRVT